MLNWRARWQVSEYVQNSIWIVPAVFAIVAIVLARIEAPSDLEREFAVHYSSESARSLLSAISSGMIAFTGFTFSILLLAVQFGSNQFSPRMLRRFLRAGTTKIALGLFIATFLYSLQVERLTDGHAGIGPNLEVTFAEILLLASMFYFLRLISKTTSGLRVASVVGELGRDGSRVIDDTYPDVLGAGGEAEAAELGPCQGEVRYAGRPGVLQSIDRRGLVRSAEQGEGLIELVPAIGDFVVEGEVLFRLYGGAAKLPSRDLQQSVAIGDERTLKQDPAFALRLLADISAKALSPGVNDPSTATQALDQIEVLLRKLGSRRLRPGSLSDAGGVERLRWPAAGWDDYLSLALDETRQYGAGSIQISRRLNTLLAKLRDSVPAERRAAVDSKIALVAAASNRGFSDELDRLAAGAIDPQGIGTSRPRSAG